MHARLFVIHLNKIIWFFQFGASSRSEKIRTYNFNQDRITDHRIGLTLHNMDSFLEGSELLDKMLVTLMEESDLERLAEFISSLK